MNKKSTIYFASDFHLGAPNAQSSREREERLVRWLSFVSKDASEIFLMGDIFDFWFEYKHAIPKGFARLQGKIAELTDQGISIYFFTGNHDMWMFDYFEKELGVHIYRKPVQIERSGKKFYLAHGDGLGPKDHFYKVLKKIFGSKICQWLFARIHPNFGVWLANKWSKNSRIANDKKEKFESEEQEWLVIYSKEFLEKEHIDYFIFGHRHLPLDILLKKDSRYINLGEWINYNSYAVFDGNDLRLEYFEKDKEPLL